MIDSRDMTNLLTQHLIDEFFLHGVVVVPAVLSNQELEEAICGMNESLKYIG